MIPYIDAKFMQLGCKYSLNFIYNKNTINSTVLFSFTPFKRDISNSSKHEVTSKSEYDSQKKSLDILVKDDYKVLQKQQLPKLEKNIEYILSKNKINKKIHDEEKRKKTHETLYYVAAVALFCLSASYFAVPLYAAFCQMTGFGGTTQRTSDINSLNAYMEKTSHITPDSAPLRPITVRFEGNVHPGMDWEFKPEHKEIQLRIGDTVLTFYKAINRMKIPFTGVSTYNVQPPQAGLYFEKIQCFCFDEQRLRSGEAIDMPLFFFIDPAMADDWRLDGVDHITLNYTFFPAGEDNDDDE